MPRRAQASDDVLRRQSVHQYVALFSDITVRKQMEDQIRQLAFLDPLTRLPNRRMLNDRLSQAIAASKRSGRYAAVMALDLDNFKRINDAHGHAAGDLLLIEVARRITSCVREVDTVVRIGVVLFVNHETSQEYIVDQADATMYQAKYAGRNRVQFYEENARPSSSLRTK